MIKSPTTREDIYDFYHNDEFLEKLHTVVCTESIISKLCSGKNNPLKNRMNEKRTTCVDYCRADAQKQKFNNLVEIYVMFHIYI